MTIIDPKTMKNQGLQVPKPQIRAHHESGSAIIWILVMVGIFAALNFALSQGSRTGESQMSEQEVSLAATEILDYATAIKRAVQELQINGCSDTQISFENNVVSGYENPNAPSDGSCNIFHPNGGGLQYISPNEEWLDKLSTGIPYYKLNIFWSNTPVYKFNTAENDLLFIINHINKKTCLKINDNLNIENISNDVPEDTTTIGLGNLFNGFYSATVPDPIGNDVGEKLNNKNAFCVKRPDGSGMYQFIKVLIAR